MASPTVKELELLPIFRRRIADLYLEEEDSTDQQLVRWLRARENDLEKSEEMIRKYLKWREENCINSSLLAWKPPVMFTDNYKIEFSGYDADGSPVLIFTFGRWDIRGVVERGEKVALLKYKDQMIEKIMELMKEHCSKKKDVSQFVCISDMQGFSLRHIMNKEALEAILGSVACFEANYPETLKAAYTVNTPKVFTVLFNLMKPLLTGRTLSKIFIYDSNASRWQQEILKNVPASQIPVRYGGTRLKGFTFHDEFWEDFSDIASQLENDEKEENHGMTIVNVAAGDKLMIPVELPSEGKRIEWGFNVADKDIGFSILFGDDIGNGANNKSKTHCKSSEIVKYERTSSHSGWVICKSKGTYHLIFDNTFSKWKPKVVHYKVNTL